jgi:hypothetical protein
LWLLWTGALLFDLNENLTELLQPGDLLCCDGGCNLAYHTNCVGLSEAPETEEWICPECERAGEDVRIFFSLEGMLSDSLKKRRANVPSVHSKTSKSALLVRSLVVLIQMEEKELYYSFTCRPGSCVSSLFDLLTNLLLEKTTPTTID